MIEVQVFYLPLKGRKASKGIIAGADINKAIFLHHSCKSITKLAFNVYIYRYAKRTFSSKKSFGVSITYTTKIPNYTHHNRQYFSTEKEKESNNIFKQYKTEIIKKLTSIYTFIKTHKRFFFFLILTIIILTILWYNREFLFFLTKYIINNLRYHTGFKGFNDKSSKEVTEEQSSTDYTKKHQSYTAERNDKDESIRDNHEQPSFKPKQKSTGSIYNSFYKKNKKHLRSQLFFQEEYKKKKQLIKQAQENTLQEQHLNYKKLLKRRRLKQAQWAYSDNFSNESAWQSLNSRVDFHLRNKSLRDYQAYCDTVNTETNELLARNADSNERLQTLATNVSGIYYEKEYRRAYNTRLEEAYAFMQREFPRRKHLRPYMAEFYPEKKDYLRDIQARKFDIGDNFFYASEVYAREHVADGEFINLKQECMQNIMAERRILINRTFKTYNRVLDNLCDTHFTREDAFNPKAKRRLKQHNIRMLYRSLNMDGMPNYESYHSYLLKVQLEIQRNNNKPPL
jgi:hypothetical protein